MTCVKILHLSYIVIYLLRSISIAKGVKINAFIYEIYNLFATIIKKENEAEFFKIKYL